MFYYPFYGTLHPLYCNHDRGVITVKIRIKYIMEHVEIYDLKGNFLFSADTVDEAYRELKIME